MHRSIVRLTRSWCARTAALALAATVAHAQGGNDCTAPTAITGVGSFPFNTTAATTGTQGQALGNCGTLYKDVWYAYTAAVTDGIQFDTCNSASFDTRLNVFAGAGCPAANPLDCDDDSCSLQSVVQISATAGVVYMVQFGSFSSTNPGGTGNVNVSVVVPPPPCGTATGPDVIVGEINGIANYDITGSLDAIALGTTSCNMGTVNLNWFSNTNQHPVIGGNLYRYRVESGSGRFEQIGMSWLKHGFFALSGNLCCVSCAGTDGSTLGVGCSDPYGAGLNGGQSNLGPRYQVNAHTGVFTYPPANPSWTGNTARRCEYLLSDVDLSAGVRYFGETQYVTPDDAAAGNQNNNASYQELSATLPGGTGGASFAQVGPTVREKSAIEAWPLIDPSVTIQNVQVPNDGLFKVAYRTTSLGGGQWHYEYAVYNMNADRNGGSFSIPLPLGATVSNVGFHDVTYRNGDGNGVSDYSGTDWTVTQTASSITWACQTEAANTLANALRWGTTYNFRFDANVAPTSGIATLGLWKVGSPASMTAVVDVPTGPSNVAFCFGDGVTTACPCANDSAVGQNAGCLNSLGNAGKLVMSGNPSVANDTMLMTGTGMPSGSALYYQGTNALNGGGGVVFGDGKRCVGGTVVRLAIKTNSGAGSSSFPAGGDPLLSVKGTVSAGSTRHYSIWYRDSATFCTTDLYNLTNGWSLVWTP